MSTQIAPSPTFSKVVWAGVAVTAVAAAATLALAVAGRPAGATVALVAMYAALTVAGRRWSA